MPLRDDLARIVEFPVGLGVNDDALVGAPMAEAANAFLEVDDDAIEEVFAPVSVTVQQVDCPFALRYLCRGVAAEPDALYPLDASQQPGDIIRDQTGIQALVEVHAVLAADYLLYLLEAVVGGEDVVVHQDEVRASVGGDFVHVHVRGNLTFFLRDYAPLAAVGTAAGEEAVGGLAVYLRVEGVVGLEAVDFGWQRFVDIVACASALHLVGVDVVAVVGREGEDLCGICLVVVVDAVVPFHGVALRLVVGGDFHQGEVGALAIDGDEGDVHRVMGMKKARHGRVSGEREGGAPGGASPGLSTSCSYLFIVFTEIKTLLI